MFKEDSLEGGRVKILVEGGFMLEWSASIRRVFEMASLCWARISAFPACMDVVRDFWVAVALCVFSTDLIASQEMSCGGRKISMICEEFFVPNNSSCGRPLLFFDNRGSVPVSRAANYGRHADKVVRRAECLAGEGGYAILVHFSSGPLDCGPCVILDLFSLDGERITRFGEGLDAAISSRRLALPGKFFVEME